MAPFGQFVCQPASMFIDFASVPQQFTYIWRWGWGVGGREKCVVSARTFTATHSFSIKLTDWHGADLLSCFTAWIIKEQIHRVCTILTRDNQCALCAHCFSARPSVEFQWGQPSNSSSAHWPTLRYAKRLRAPVRSRLELEAAN